ncbi:hypothetical protein AVEN_53661-1 [Araneus ventricosus]|uniref:Uncharacterized protein n=1 Tax=Araneus ventricosus TaxID=182803 RepID=A0A4Y2FZZ4_ARAVE|nr:hypothetical protein AVEN_53661-1 [Araneus ventricosus]
MTITFYLALLPIDGTASTFRYQRRRIDRVSLLFGREGRFLPLTGTGRTNLAMRDELNNVACQLCSGADRPKTVGKLGHLINLSPCRLFGQMWWELQAEWTASERDVDKNPIMETNPQKLMNNNTQEAAELLGLSSSDSLDSPSFSHFQAPKQKRKVRFKKPFRPSSRLKSGRSASSKSCKCSFMEGLKIFSYFAVLAIVGALLWYVMTLSTRIEELQAKFSDYLSIGKFLLHGTFLQKDFGINEACARKHNNFLS